jgi:branched-chain amino acid aminotransferase
MKSYYKPETILFLDGEYRRAADTHTDLYGQTLHYGYGVFEGIRAYETVNGTKIFQAQAHMDRLVASCRLMGIPLTLSTEELIQAAYQVLSRNQLTNAYLRPLVHCGPNMSLTTPESVSVMISAWDWGKYFTTPSLRVCVSSFQRPNPRSIHIDAKACGHYVNSILATSEAKARGYDEALMLDMNGFVAEAPGANFFAEIDGTLVTARKGHILPGITRRVVMDICRELDIPVIERDITPDELESADSAFFCGTAAEITPLESIDGVAMSTPWEKSLGRIVQEAYQCLVLDKNHSYVII